MRHNAVILEQSLGIRSNVRTGMLHYLVDPSVFAYSDGFVTVPTGPGFAIGVNEAYVIEQAKVGHHWREGSGFDCRLLDHFKAY